MNELKKVSDQFNVKPKIIKDTGSLKTTTVECPFCSRVFNAAAAERHIPVCQRTKNRPKPPPVKEDVIQTQRYRRIKYLRARSAAPSKHEEFKHAQYQSKQKVVEKHSQNSKPQSKDKSLNKDLSTSYL